MNSFLKFSFFFLLTVLLIPACTVETIDDEMPEDEIKDQIAQGFTNAGEEFFTESALVENTTLFSDAGYYFHLFRTTKECGGQLIGDVRFFVESTTALEPGEYDGEGPFITNTSFFGCQVVITSVTDTTIEGKVKGGDFEGDKNIEGTFVATICM